MAAFPLFSGHFFLAGFPQFWGNLGGLGGANLGPPILENWAQIGPEFCRRPKKKTTKLRQNYFWPKNPIKQGFFEFCRRFLGPIILS